MIEQYKPMIKIHSNLTKDFKEVKNPNLIIYFLNDLDIFS